jgi:signal transduction histidine kinase
VDILFQPFQKGADSTGLGLYLSRAFVRSFRGDLRYEPTAKGCCFVIELALAAPAARTEKYGSYPAVAAR